MTRSTTLIAALHAAGIEPCLDGSCMFGAPSGMHTNGGCQCVEIFKGRGVIPAMAARRFIQRMAIVIRDLADQLEESDRG